MKVSGSSAALRLLCPAIIISALSAGGCDDTVVTYVRDPGPKSVLLIGNSLSAWNGYGEIEYNTPDLMRGFAESIGVDLYLEEAVFFGLSLQEICESTDIFERIRLEKWDYAIIQGSDYDIAFPEHHDLIIGPMETLSDSIMANSLGTSIIFFMGWAMKSGVTWRDQTYTYEQFQALLRAGTIVMAERMDFIIAPIGVAWNTVVAERPDIDLFWWDSVHPSGKGSYLQACVYFSVIYRLPTIGIGVYGDIPANEVFYLQEKATATVLDSLGQWKIR